MNVTHGNLACWQHRELYDGDTKEKKKLNTFTRKKLLMVEKNDMS